jgi:hypothetical protein
MDVVHTLSNAVAVCYIRYTVLDHFSHSCTTTMANPAIPVLIHEIHD